MPFYIFFFLITIFPVFQKTENTVLSSDTLFINSNGTNLHRLEFSLNRKPLIGFQVNLSGAYKIQCSSQGSAETNLLRGTAIGLSNSGVTFPISGNDTFYIRNATTNALEQTIILEPSAGDQYKIIYGARINPSHNLGQVQGAINQWMKTTLPTLKFDRVY